MTFEATEDRRNTEGEKRTEDWSLGQWNIERIKRSGKQEKENNSY